MNGLAQDIITRDEKMRSGRSFWNSLWQDTADLVLPRRGSFTTTITPGETIHGKIFDTTAPWANEQLASGLHGFVTPSTQRWMKFTLDDDVLMDDDEVRQWLDIAADRAYAAIYHPSANFAAASHEMYLDLGSLGTAVLYIEERVNKKAPARFHAFHLAECVIQENADGAVDCLYRKFKWTAAKIVERFPETAGPKMVEMREKEPMREFEIIHAVHPVKSAMRKALGFSFDSCYVLVEEKRVLSEGGFYEFPYLSPRWTKIAGETYGRSPAMNCIHDIRMINEMSRTTLKAAQKIVDPPLMMPDEGFMLPLKTTPGGVNYYTAGSQDRIEPLQTGGNINLGLEMMNQRREQIIRAFYLDSMKLQKENKEMTAYEAAQRTEENMRAMSPMVGRLQAEALGPMIERIMAIMFRQGLIPEAPKQIQNMDYKIEYISPVARALKMGQLTSLQRMVGVVSPFLETKPETLDKFDADQIIDFAATQLDVPANLILSDKAVAKIRAARAEQQAKAEEMAQAQSMAQTMQSGGKALESFAKAQAGQV